MWFNVQRILANNIESVFKWYWIPEKTTKQNKYEIDPYLNMTLKNKHMKKKKSITFFSLFINILRNYKKKSMYCNLVHIMNQCLKDAWYLKKTTKQYIYKKNSYLNFTFNIKKYEIIIIITFFIIIISINILPKKILFINILQKLHSNAICMLQILYIKQL